MSSFMENGPSNHNGEAEQVWERPWTVEEMQKSGTNWSLAADSGVWSGMHSYFIFILFMHDATFYRWFRVNVSLYVCSYFFFCKTSLRGCCQRHMRLRSSWMVLSGTLKPPTAAYTQCLMTSSCCPTHSSLKMYVHFFHDFS